MQPPKMRSWNLALRLGLEIGALIGLGLAAWTQTEGAAPSCSGFVSPRTLINPFSFILLPFAGGPGGMAPWSPGFDGMKDTTPQAVHRVASPVEKFRPSVIGKIHHVLRGETTFSP